VHLYRDRLRLEGSVLTLCGVIGCLTLLLTTDTATAGPVSTIGQLALVAVLLAVLGPRAVRAWAASAQQATPGMSGDPTPLWQLPLIVAGLTLLVGLPTGAWDAGLRVTGGCVLVGLAQAVLLERAAAAEEARRGARLLRAPGSRIWRTRLAWTVVPPPPG
jgi:hypothetical protein